MTTQYQVKVGNEVIDFQGPDNLSDEQITALADKTLRTAKPGQSFPHSVYGGVIAAPQQAQQNKSSALGSFFRNIPGGGLFNFDDEIAAAGNALIPGAAEADNLSGVSGGHQQNATEAGGFWNAFKNNMADFQRQKQADVAQHETASNLGNVAGAIAATPTIARAGGAALAMFPKVEAAVAARPVLSTVAAGGAAGTVSGAGAGEGNREQSAALGGLSGLVTAFGLTKAIQFAPAVARYAKVLFNKGANSEAVRQMAQALQRDGFDVSTPAGSQALQQELQRYSGKPVSLADIGQATRSRAGVALRTPSPAQSKAIDIVAARQAGAPQRLAGDIRANVAPRTDVHALDEALTAQRAQQAEPLREKALYEQATPPTPVTVTPTKAVLPDEAPDSGLLRAMQRGPDNAEVPVAPQEASPATGLQSRIVDDPTLQQLARLPLAQRALKGAIGQATAERDLLAAQGKDISHLPDIEHAGATLDMRSFDYLKRFLDDQVNSLYKRGDTNTFSAAEAGNVKALRDAIRGRLREYNPDYADYLDAYRGSSDMIDALAAGREYPKLDPEQIAAEQAGRSTAEQELYRVGAARNLLDKIREAKDTSSPAARILNSPESRAQLEATGVTPQNMARLNTAVEQERTFNKLNTEMQGSQTAQRLIAQREAEDANTVPLPISGGFSVGGSYGFLGLGALARAILNKGLPARNAAVNNELIPRLFETNPAAIDSIIKELQQHGEVAAAKELQRQKLARRISIGTSMRIGSMVALPDNGGQ